MTDADAEIVVPLLGDDQRDVGEIAASINDKSKLNTVNLLKFQIKLF